MIVFGRVENTSVYLLNITADLESLSSLFLEEVTPQKPKQFSNLVFGGIG
jgi:hypothetical protein